MVAAGIVGKIRSARFAGIALLCITLLKLFIHDLAKLQALYRVGALLGVTLVAFAASLLYQKFFAQDAKGASSGPESATPKPPV